MDPNVAEWLNLLFRWAHVIAGITWIGHLYFFNWVNSQVAKTYDADSKRKVVPELMPRALYFFRWGAAWTWITGILLLGLVYYMSVVPADAGANGHLSTGAIVGICLAVILVGFVVYDQLWKAVKNEYVAGTISFVLTVGVAFGLSRITNGRTMFIHIGALFGTSMAANVWMRIWPAQRKIIAAAKGTGPAPDPSVGAMAGLRSKHNTYMSVPLVLFMVSNHFATVYGSEYNWIYVGVFILVGWGFTKWVYLKSATSAPAQFEPKGAAAAAPAAK